MNISCFCFELFSARVVKARHHVAPSSNNVGDDAWLMKIELKREEPGEINKDDGIKKAMEDQAPAAKDILQLDHNLLTTTEIEAFKMIELARI